MPRQLHLLLHESYYYSTFYPLPYSYSLFCSYPHSYTSLYSTFTSPVLLVVSLNAHRSPFRPLNVSVFAVHLSPHYHPPFLRLASVAHPTEL